MKKKPKIEDYDAPNISSKSLNLELEKLEPKSFFDNPLFIPVLVVIWLVGLIWVYPFYPIHEMLSDINDVGFIVGLISVFVVVFLGLSLLVFYTIIPILITL